HTRVPINRGHTLFELSGSALSVDWGPSITEAIRREGIGIDGMRAQAQRMEFASEASRSNYLSQLDRVEQEIQARSPRSVAPKIARNAPCPCGSGKKYKQCCGKDV
ncbi:MAG TPA: SEC-C metal-binding domain-containing protein, partial [Clostridia bacterium]|nr:SEC-C metal-binding domain-containing protein [Clostridia bacterium]